MSSRLRGGAALGLALCTSLAADFTPAAQQFQQEVAQHFTERDGAPTGPVQLVESTPGGTNRAFAAGRWYEFWNGHWNLNAGLRPQNDSQFVFAGQQGQPLEATIPWREVRQILRAGATNWVASPRLCLAVREGGDSVSLPWPERLVIPIGSDHSLARSSPDPAGRSYELGGESPSLPRGA